jgi:hypothetical protein
MSAGAFTLTRYQTDAGDIVPIKLQPETLQATFGGVINNAPTGAPSAGFPSADVSGGRRSIGIHPRIVTVRITAGLPPGYQSPSTHRVACLNTAVYNAAVKGAAAGYLGGTGTVVSKSPEVIV